MPALPRSRETLAHAGGDDMSPHRVGGRIRITGRQRLDV
jgi:hypothetical protein